MREKTAITETLEFFNPDPDALLVLLRPQVDDSLLREIAAADYGLDVNAHLSALRRIHRGVMPDPSKWHPFEVLELIRWSEPDDPEWKPGLTGHRGHLMRAFACSALLRAAAEPRNQDYLFVVGENQTVVQLISSALVLGTDVIDSVRRCLAWRIPLLSERSETGCFFALGIVLLSMSRDTGKTEQEHLVTLLDWIVAEDRRIREMDYSYTASDVFVLGLTNHDQCHDKWRELVRQLFLSPAFPIIEELDIRLRDVASRIV